MKMFAISALLMLNLVFLAQASSFESENSDAGLVTSSSSKHEESYNAPYCDSHSRSAVQPGAIYSEQQFDPAHGLVTTYQATGTISVEEAMALVPDLRIHLEVLQPALITLETNEIIIAALKARSFIPDYVIEENSAADYNSDSSDSLDSGNEMGNFEFLTSRSYFIRFLKSLLKKLSKASRFDAINQIAHFVFTNGSLEEFITEKEAEKAQLLAEAVINIQQLRALFQINTATSHGSFSLDNLLNIVNYLHNINLDHLNIIHNQDNPSINYIIGIYLRNRIQKLAQYLETLYNY